MRRITTPNDYKIPTKWEKTFRQTLEKMVGFSFVTPVTGLNRPNTGKEDDDDDEKNHRQEVSVRRQGGSHCHYERGEERNNTARSSEQTSFSDMSARQIPRLQCVACWLTILHINSEDTIMEYTVRCLVGEMELPRENLY
jgi:hypothetical protein